MKKSIVFISLTIAALSFVAFGHVNSVGQSSKEPVNLMFDLSTREFASASKQVLNDAITLSDFMPRSTDWTRYPIKSLKLTIFKGEEKFSETGTDLALTNSQLKLLQKLEYDDLFRLDAHCIGPNPDNPEMTDFDMFYSFVVVPEIQAVYPGGEDAIIDFVKNRSVRFTKSVKQENLERGFLVFTVSKSGEIQNARHLISCGYPKIDDKMVDLFKDLPETWKPAVNADGQKVGQEFVFYFGQWDGC